MTAATTSAPPLMLDWLLPEFDATVVEHRVVVRPGVAIVMRGFLAAVAKEVR